MTCFGPSQSSTTHLDGMIQLRLGGGRSARLARESASMVMPEKKWGGTASDDSMPPRIVVCSTLLAPQLLPLSAVRWNRTKVVPETRTSPAMAGLEPVGCSIP